MKTEIGFEHTALASHNRYVHAGLSNVNVKSKEKLNAKHSFDEFHSVYIYSLKLISCYTLRS